MEVSRDSLSLAIFDHRVEPETAGLVRYESFARAKISVLQVQQGRTLWGAVRRGALAGALGSAALLAVATLTFGSQGEAPGWQILLPVIPAGAVIGGFIGALIPRDRWRRIAP